MTSAAKNPDEKPVSSETVEERPHHPYSPSSLASIEVCPAFKNRQVKTLHQRTVAGTRAHGVTETGDDDTRLGDDDAAAAAECLDFWDRLKAIYEEEAKREYEELLKTSTVNMVVPLGPSPIVELKETYLPVDALVFDDCASTTAGYSDRIMLNWNQTEAIGADWKFGFWPVEHAEENIQCIAYVLGIFKRFPTVQKVRFFIKQPHLNIVSEGVFTRDQIPALYLRVQTIVARARDARTAGDFASAAPHVPVCNFCDNLGKCPKVLAFACHVGKKFYPVEIPESIDPTVGTDPKQTVMALRLAQVVKVWCDAFRRQVTDRIIRGDAPLPPGQKIQTLEKREIVDPAKLKDASLRYLTQAEYDSTLETTFGALEEKVSDNAPRGAKKSTVEEFRKNLIECGAVRLKEPISFLRAVAVKEG